MINKNKGIKISDKLSDLIESKIFITAFSIVK